MASYGRAGVPRRAARARARRRRRRVRAPTPVDWDAFAPARRGRRRAGTAEHADLAASVQRRLEEVLLELAGWLHERTGDRDLALAGGVALNCVANTRLLARAGRSTSIWVQPAAGDAGTALGAALQVAARRAATLRRCRPRRSGRGWTDDELRGWLRRRRGRLRAPDDLAEPSAEVLAADGIVAWFQGRSEFGPRALGHRSLLADPRPPRTSSASTTSRAASSSGRSRRWCSPSGRRRSSARPAARAPYMLFTHGVRAGVARPDPRRRARRRHRPRADRRPRARSRSWPRCSSAFERAHRACRSSSTRQPEHRGPADGRRPARRAGVLRLRAGRRCSRIGPFVVRRPGRRRDGARPRRRSSSRPSGVPPARLRWPRSASPSRPRSGQVVSSTTAARPRATAVAAAADADR